MTVYINMTYNGVKETVDEFETYKQAREMLPEYRQAYDWIPLWISSRCCANWKE